MRDDVIQYSRKDDKLAGLRNPETRPHSDKLAGLRNPETRPHSDLGTRQNNVKGNSTKKDA